MTVNEPNVVDFIGISRDSDEVVLTVSDHLAWDDPEHLLVLQRKLNAYFAFIDSGELLDAHPDAKGRRIRIDVVCSYPPVADAVHFFDQAETVANSAGYDLSWRIFAA